MSNRIKGIFWLSISVLILASPMTSMGQLETFKQSLPEQLWFNVESSPLEARLSSNQRYLQLLNRSPGHINRYRIGCVQQKRDTRVLRSLPVVTTDLEAGRLLINSLSLYTDSLERCARDAGKLAVVEVRFRDGSIWRIK